MKNNILVVDIGNSSTSLGLYADDRVIKSIALATEGMTQSEREAQIKKLIGRSCPLGVCACSVVPNLKASWERVFRRQGLRDVFWVSHKAKLGVRIQYPKPSKIGPDRLANASAVWHRYGAPAIVADFGTALTFDIVSRGGAYTGGIIAPGLPLMFSYLADKTALLPHIEPGPVRGYAGKSTEDAMRLGAKWGYRGMVREILKELKSKMGRGVTVCATGGYASWVIRGLDRSIKIDQDLTLYGLGKIYELNRES